MTGMNRTLELDFVLETDDGQADLQQSAAALQDAATALPDVTAAKTRIPEAAVRDFNIDPVTVGTVLLTIQVAVKGAEDIIDSLDAVVDKLDDLVDKIKDLGVKLGLPRLWVWLRTERINVSDLTAEKLRELADESTSADN